MRGNHDRRLSKLELDRPPIAEDFYVWRHGPAETTEQAIARRFPDGLPASARIFVISRQFNGEHKKPGG